MGMCGGSRLTAKKACVKECEICQSTRKQLCHYTPGPVLRDPGQGYTLTMPEHWRDLLIADA